MNKQFAFFFICFISFFLLLVLSSCAESEESQVLTTKPIVQPEITRQVLENCEEKTTDILRNSCYYKWAAFHKNIDFCQNISSISRSDNCYKLFYSELLNESVCDKISLDMPSVVEVCKAYFNKDFREISSLEGEDLSQRISSYLFNDSCSAMRKSFDEYLRNPIMKKGELFIRSKRYSEGALYKGAVVTIVNISESRGTPSKYSPGHPVKWTYESRITVLSGLSMVDVRVTVTNSSSNTTYKRYPSGPVELVVGNVYNVTTVDRFASQPRETQVSEIIAYDIIESGCPK